MVNHVDRSIKQFSQSMADTIASKVSTLVDTVGAKLQTEAYEQAIRDCGIQLIDGVLFVHEIGESDNDKKFSLSKLVRAEIRLAQDESSEVHRRDSAAAFERSAKLFRRLALAYEKAANKL